MKIGNKAPSSVRGRNREATAVEKSVKSMIRKYGFDLVRYVSWKIIQTEVEKMHLAKVIQTKESELEILRKKKL